MHDDRVGAAIRAVRLRRGWHQQDVADRAGVSRAFVSEVERGHLSAVSLGTLRRLAAALDVRLDVVARWRGGELDRLLNTGPYCVPRSPKTAVRCRPGSAIPREP